MVRLSLPVTIPAGHGSGPAPLPPQLQMAAFTPAMQGILHIRAPRLGAESMEARIFLPAALVSRRCAGPGIRDDRAGKPPGAVRAPGG